MDASALAVWLPALLAFCRVSAFLLALPVLSLRAVPFAVRAGLAGLLALALSTGGGLGTISASVATDGSWTLYALKEILIGSLLGFTVALVVMAAQAAGSILSFQVQFSFGEYINPSSPLIGGQLESMFNVLAGLLFFATDAHLLFLRALGDSFELLPIADISPRAPAGMLELVPAMFALALRLSFPLLGALFLADVGVGLLNRLVPQMNALLSAVPGKVLLLFFLAMVTMPFLGGAVSAALEDAARMVLRLAAAMNGGA